MEGAGPEMHLHRYLPAAPHFLHGPLSGCFASVSSSAELPPESSESPFPFTNDPNTLDAFGSTEAGTATTVVSSSQPFVRSGTPDNLIPVYCSILAAVVVGLVAYIAFKR